MPWLWALCFLQSDPELGKIVILELKSKKKSTGWLVLEKWWWAISDTGPFVCFSLRLICPTHKCEPTWLIVRDDGSNRSKHLLVALCRGPRSTYGHRWPLEGHLFITNSLKMFLAKMRGVKPEKISLHLRVVNLNKFNRVWGAQRCWGFLKIWHFSP